MKSNDFIMINNWQILIICLFKYIKSLILMIMFLNLRIRCKMVNNISIIIRFEFINFMTFYLCIICLLLFIV